ncbi:hypothetical protein N1937_06905 [Rhizobium sp. WSM4643]|uniref:hypothetical protein n=1 Tax=Rhizobium sp. WSM4643 TaxID=3138253 RepID=UPI0021A8B1AA|nr:hypothetical protein [Rhizobium leguminosarum]UWM76960.1 hypothetical protein N1937_06905 [Rhizobium leguminosarum bv. viciae]
MSFVLEEFENLHPDDEIAFAELVQGYQSEFDRNMAEMDERADTTYVHYTFMNKVLAAAGELNIEPFAKWEVPPRGRIFDEFDEFVFALQRYLTGLKIRKSRAAKVYSVELPPTIKTQIHFFIGRIREVVEKAGLEERKKNSLYKKLNAFAADVDKARTGFDNAMLMGIDVAHLAKEFGEAIKPATDFVRSINELLGGEKAKEPEQSQLPPPEDRKRIEAPRKQIEGPKGGNFSRDLDDDIPF